MPLQNIVSLPEIDHSTPSLAKFSAVLYLKTLRLLPVVVRSWWSGLTDRHLSIQVRALCGNSILKRLKPFLSRSITSQQRTSVPSLSNKWVFCSFLHVESVLADERSTKEIDTIAKRPKGKFDEYTMKASHSAGVSATYVKDDLSITSKFWVDSKVTVL